jgi:8-oxo-dGTP diphosphatase
MNETKGTRMPSDFPIPSTRAVIENGENRILFIRRHHSSHGNGLWCLPGGKVDVGETVEESLIREVREELGVEAVSPEFLFYQDSLPFEKGKMHCIVFYFHCGIEGPIRINDESSEYMWMDVERMDHYSIAFRNDEGIRRYRAFINPAT